MFPRAKLFALLAGMVLGVFLLAPATAALSSIQDKDGADGQGKKENSITITGCLQKGAADGQYTIAGPDGTSYQLTGSKVDLKGHVGHKVTITGKPSKTAQEGSQAGQLEVTSLKMVSTTCS
jgi:hypothetical protein